MIKILLGQQAAAAEIIEQLDTLWRSYEDTTSISYLSNIAMLSISSRDYIHQRYAHPSLYYRQQMQVIEKQFGKENELYVNFVDELAYYYAYKVDSF
ncbi:MAG: hypothetical protein HC892_11205 [Saprospiraceae bacterium]|nr:hypothetical protein [Saprospiraceae bacterium]